MILRFLDAEIEEFYAKDVQALSARNLKTTIRMTSAFLVPINMYWIFSRLALYTWSFDQYFLLVNFGPLLFFLGVVLVISMVPRFVPQIYCERSGAYSGGRVGGWRVLVSGESGWYRVLRKKRFFARDVS